MSDTTKKPVMVRKGHALPPPRPGVRHVHLFVIPVIVISDDILRKHVDRRFHWPMIVLALLMLPLLVVELLVPDKSLWLWWVCWSAMTLIWFAFLIEFVVKITIAECRLEYAKRNWLDIFIILLPALRPLRIASITRTSRLFTLRGVGLKFARYIFTVILGMEATDRLLHRIGLKKNREQKHPDKMTRHQISRELLQLRSLANDWEDWYAMHQAYLEARGVELYEVDRPLIDALEESEREEDIASPHEEPTMPPPCESPSPN
ncbi:MAG: hypothetical protein O7G85_03880 [Planctomycetota bacterium]|nr:hypothetical protein [Planctomycetota bacterium]